MQRALQTAIEDAWMSTGVGNGDSLHETPTAKRKNPPYDHSGEKNKKFKLQADINENNAAKDLAINFWSCRHSISEDTKIWVLGMHDEWLRENGQSLPHMAPKPWFRALREAGVEEGAIEQSISDEGLRSVVRRQRGLHKKQLEEARLKVMG